MSKQLVVWFDDKGDLLTRASSWTLNQKNPHFHNFKSEDAKDFSDKMQYVKILDYHKMAARVYLKSICSGRTYTMFIDDFDEVISANKFVNNQIEGTFRFLKKGQAQAIKLIIEKAL